MRKQRGFTLLEILVVVTIMSLLIALLFPVYGAVKKAARRARCLYNLKQITVALHDYAITNNNKLPSANPWVLDSSYNRTGPLYPYLSGDGFRVLECPEDPVSA